ncbi:restriction endonuclease [Parvibacter caecicola]|uniref:Type III restriction enzyme n=1 Tax=Parvibacter caecicola TaxID=747645 RepID=A0A7W5D1L7_9ACTN|nr:DEAD/DEAH box helicase family protein [Parvibacter caecicola]MBB3171020.1 type III restriction enzyme [Parvibacter caecicola]MCR2042185.1 DEAD/DEAH box helicase family protein [Parvibacter caecicola]
MTAVFEGQRRVELLSYMRDIGKVRLKESLRQKSAGQFSLGAELSESMGYGNAPLSINAQELLRNINRVQSRNQLEESLELSCDIGACQLDVEMETGTGKTYVYTKTMFELNRLYGWTKFIIVVPSIAIREGVNKSLQSTEQHFFEQYERSIRYFIYDSDRLNELDAYSQSADINVMIINMQAFNSSMKEGANNKAARIIFDERDDFGSRRPIDVIAANNPIVIVDEPQKMGKKNSATWKGIERFNPLFVLNYSATHREKHNMVYALDALDAFNEKLVKRIEVKGFELKNMRGTDGYLYLKDIIVSKNKAPVAVVEFKAMSAGGKVVKKTMRFNEGDSIYDATGDIRLEAYRDYVIASGNDGIVPDQDGRIGYVRFLNGEVLQRGVVYGDSAEDDMRRVQIRETIASHLQKEEALFYRGIKCLSLFFIDEVAKYRDISGNGETVGYGKVFEEEYERAVEERLSNPTLDDERERAYLDYLRRDTAHAVHSGYFSIDKKGNAIESSEKKAEQTDGLGANDENAQRAYDLILKDKERLLSFEEPVRFIFSHSALREGWDNPNIFQICTLKSSGSETGKRQEVGRGLRLCVDQKGERQDAMYLGTRDVHNVNVLTVVASESYSSFVDALQKDIKAELRDRPTVVEMDFFAGRQVTLPNTGETVTFSERESKELYKCLIKGDFLDDNDRPSCKFREGGFFEYAIVNLPEDMREEPKLQAAELLVRSAYDPSALSAMITDGNVPKITRNALNDNYYRREFQELWKRINKKHAYTVSFDDEELIRKAVTAIDANLQVSELSYTITTGTQKETAKREDIEDRTHFKTKSAESRALELDERIDVTYDLVGEVAQAAKVTRRTAATILSRISPLKYSLYKRNPEEFIKKASSIIVDEKATTVIDHVSYHQIDEEFDTNIFTERMPENISKALKAQKNIQDYVFFDSQKEKEFAEAMDVATEVCVYAKMPRTFTIPTPVGEYAPDWAIAFNEGAVRHIYFIAETKGTMDSMELSTVEQTKIACAKKVFNELSTSQVRYHEVSTYDELLTVIQGVE